MDEKNKLLVAEKMAWREIVPTGDMADSVNPLFSTGFAACWKLKVQAENSARVENRKLQTRIDALVGLINHPRLDGFFTGVRVEAAFQREKWGEEHDKLKTAFDWFWLIGYVSQKAAGAIVSGDSEKAKHHIITTAAVLFNWYKFQFPEDTE